MELSTPGGDNQDQALLQVLLNIIDFGMMPQEAVEAPRFQSEHYYSSFGGARVRRRDADDRIAHGAGDGGRAGARWGTR